MASEPREGGRESAEDGVPPPPFKSWRQLYILVLSVLAAVIAVFGALTVIYK